MLRASSKVTGDAVDLQAITGGDASNTGVEHGDLLIAFAEAAFAAPDEHDTKLAAARDQLLAAAGREALVDSAAVVGNFQRMVRIADGTGIPLDSQMNALTAGLREDLGIDQYTSGANTPKVGNAAKAAGRVGQAAVMTAMKWATRLRK